MGYEWPPVPSLRRRFEEKVKRPVGDGCWLWTAFTNPPGYGMIRNGSGMALAHRVSWVLTNGEIPEGKQVLHHCDNPPCVNPDHLYIGTNADNMADKARRGRSHVPQPNKRGEKHPLAKLTDAQVEEIRRQPFVHGSGKELAERFGVSRSSITNIRKGKVWKHV